MGTRAKAPAFQFYPRDFLMDGPVLAMSLAEKGAYITLLSVCWLEGAIPDDASQLARILGVPVGEFRKVWPALAPCFQRRDDGRLVNKRLEEERRKQAAYRERMSARGTQGAVGRWGSH
jgi:uncharacterized protein YdaU (DUF1376 family)